MHNLRLCVYIYKSFHFGNPKSDVKPEWFMFTGIYCGWTLLNSAFRSQMSSGKGFFQFSSHSYRQASLPRSSPPPSSFCFVRVRTILYVRPTLEKSRFGATAVTAPWRAGTRILKANRHVREMSSTLWYTCVRQRQVYKCAHTDV